ncbi:MAG: hypothetical protein K2O00_08470 [Muribaculaceae bacterium]|nr:hypothetical protein [Muribaculaceae bacterium]
MKKFLITFLLLLVTTGAALASDAMHSIRWSQKNIGSNDIEKHNVAIRKMTAALELPDITQEEMNMIREQIIKHKDRIKQLSYVPPKQKPDNGNNGSVDQTPKQEQPAPEPKKRTKDLKIYDVKFTNEFRGELINDVATEFYASDMRYLYGQLCYDGGPEEIEKRVYVKLYDPQGNLKRYNDADDFTFTQRVTFYPLDEMDGYVAGIGNSSKSIFSPGVYRYEVWIDGKCVVEKKVEFKLKPGEQTVGTAEIKAVSITPKNYSVSFEVTMQALNMPDTDLTTRIVLYNESGNPINGNPSVERTDHILYDEAVLTFNMNIPYTKIALPKGWSGDIFVEAHILNSAGKVLCSYAAGKFKFTKE